MDSLCIRSRQKCSTATVRRASAGAELRGDASSSLRGSSFRKPATGSPRSECSLGGVRKTDRECSLQCGRCCHVCREWRKGASESDRHLQECRRRQLKPNFCFCPTCFNFRTVFCVRTTVESWSTRHISIRAGVTTLVDLWTTIRLWSALGTWRIVCIRSAVAARRQQRYFWATFNVWSTFAANARIWPAIAASVHVWTTITTYLSIRAAIAPYFNLWPAFATDIAIRPTLSTDRDIPSAICSRRE